MNAPQTAIIVLILSATLGAAGAQATPPPPRVGAEKPEAKPEVKPEVNPDHASKPPVKPSKPSKRRAVEQRLDGMPPSAAPPARLVPQPAPPSVVQPMPQPIPSPQAQGGNYQGGVGTTLIGPQGKVCSDNGITVQCF